MQTHALLTAAVVAFTSAGISPLAGQAGPQRQKETFTAPRCAGIAVHTVEAMLYNPSVDEVSWRCPAESAYRFGKHEILTILERILMTAQFEIAQKDLVWAALGDYRRGKADFSDYYIGRANEKLGASLTLTFDKALKGEPRFRLLAR